MDRNTNPGSTTLTFPVALRKESVDRNLVASLLATGGSRVALRKESVDRNHAPKYHRIPPRRSLSARRAWIEIIGLTYDGLIASGRSPQGERG